MTISIEELQKNISIIKNAKEPIIVIDKKSKKRIAIIEPIKEDDMDLFEELMQFEKKKLIKSIQKKILKLMQITLLDFLLPRIKRFISL